MWEVIGAALGLGALIVIAWAILRYLNVPQMPQKRLDKLSRTALARSLAEVITLVVDDHREKAAKIVEHHGRNCIHCNVFCAKKIAADIRANKTYDEFEKVIHDRPTTLGTPVMDKAEAHRRRCRDD